MSKEPLITLRLTEKEALALGLLAGNSLEDWEEWPDHNTDGARAMDKIVVAVRRHRAKA